MKSEFLRSAFTCKDFALWAVGVRKHYLVLYHCLSIEVGQKSSIHISIYQLHYKYGSYTSNNRSRIGAFQKTKNGCLTSPWIVLLELKFSYSDCEWNTFMMDVVQLQL